MDGRDNNFGIDFAPIGQAIKKARIAQNMTREQLAGIAFILHYQLTQAFFNL